MNKNYKVIYCKSTQTWVAVSELAKSGGKGKRAAVAAQNPYPLARLTLALLISLGGVGQQVMAASITCDQTGSKFSCGVGASAKNNAVAVGNGASSLGSGTAIGANASTTGGQGTAVGKNATATQQSVAIGVLSTTLGQGAVAVGQKASSGTAATQQTTAIGQLSKAVGDQSTAIGANTYAKGNSSIAIGGDDLDTVASTKAKVWDAGYTAAEAQAANDTNAAIVYGRVSGGDWLVHFENNQNAPAGSKGDKNGVQRYTETQSGHGAVAIGVMSTASDLATSFGTRANAYGLASLALGVGSQAGVKTPATTVIAGVTYTEGDGALANGAGTKAIGSSSVATGAGSIAWNKSDIAIGDGAVAGTNTNNGLYQNDAIAIGTGAQATGKQSIAIGTGNQVAAASSGAFGDPNIINGKNIANIAISGSYAIGNDNFINTSNTFVLGNDNVTNAVGAKTSVANSVYLGNKTAVTSGNAVGTKNLTQAGVAGATTTAGDTGTVASATVGGITYGGFAGATGTGAVSVGAAGAERRVQNVAAGEISATSTDAINGSQLYSVAKTLGDAIGNVRNVANAGTASAMAMASLPQPHDPGANMVSAAIGAYEDQSALSIGLSSISDNGKWVIKGQVTYDTQSNFGAGLGAGYQW